MPERSFAARADSSRNRSWLQRKAPLRVGAPDDAYEREADRVADAVTSGRSASRPGVPLSRVPVTQVQRDNGKPKSEEEKYKEAGQKLGEAFLATDIGKKLREKVEQDPLVKGAKAAGESFIGTLPGKVITGAAAVGAVSALAATHKELPAQIPEIPLDKIRPGLKVKITYEGPVDSPAKAMITFSYTEQTAGGKKPAKTKTEMQREENARMAAELAKFRAGLRYAPGTPEAKRQQEEEEALKRAAFSGVGKLPEFGKVKTFPGLAPTPSYGFKLKPFSLLDEELKLRPVGEVTGAQAEEKKKEEQGAPVQRKSADGSATSAVPPLVNDVLDAAGQPLDAGTRRQMESRFGHDFAGVRVHIDARAAASARAISARAYTVGNDIVFSSGQFSPHTTSGQWMLAHELTHVVQQSESRIPPKVQRLGFFESIGVLLGISEGDYSREELFEYLRKVMTSRRIERAYDSDNKARDVVRKWRSGKLDIDLVPAMKKLLIQEMQDGVVLDGDREGIMTVLENSNNRDLREIFSPGGVNPKQLRKDLDSGNFKKRLESFFSTRFEGGAEALVEKGEVKPVGGVDLKKLSPEKRREFIEGHFEKSDWKFAGQILDDLTQSAGELDFSDEKELADEIEKRMRTSRLMQESQKLFGRAFEYPNKKAAKACLPENKGKPLDKQKPNPRVNEEAKDYWGPVREGSPVPGYQSSYFFELTPLGKKAAYQALTTLFKPQDHICKMTLIHCDYLASVVHLRAFAETIGVPEFNDRVRKGLLDMKLTYFGFQYLEPYLARSGKAVSLHKVRPGSEEDLIIGDHVIFWNHRAYDLINEQIRNAWRLENAILTERRGKEDYFLGHGSGKQTKDGMKRILIREYNDVVGQADRIINKTRSKDAKVAAPARQKMQQKFPRVQEVGEEWRIRGWAHGKMFNDPLKRIETITDPELIGLRDPDDPSKMNWVTRPFESR